MEHKENLGMRLYPQPIFIFDVSLFLCTFRECDKGAQMIRMFILTFCASSWALKLFLKCIIFSNDTLTTNCLLGSISPYTLHSQSTKVSLYTSPLSYKHSNGRKVLITSPTHFQCTGYLHIQMLIQTPLSNTPIIVFNTVVPCIRLFNPMP